MSIIRRASGFLFSNWLALTFYILFPAHPISHLVRQRIGPLVREIYRTEPDLPLEEVFTSDGIAALETMNNGNIPGSIGAVTVGEFLGYSYHPLHQQPVDIGLLKSGHAARLRKRTVQKVGE